MARAESPDSANSQFFIMLQPRFSLDQFRPCLGRDERAAVVGGKRLDAGGRWQPRGRGRGSLGRGNPEGAVPQGGNLRRGKEDLCGLGGAGGSPAAAAAATGAGAAAAAATTAPAPKPARKPQRKQ